MKTKIYPLGVVLAAVFLAGCSTINSRIEDKQAAFDAYPAEVQTAIRDGRVEIGFTPEQVQIALDEPDRIYTRTTTTGQSQVWAWEDHSPRIGFGVGVGTGFGSSPRVGTGVGVSTSDDRGNDRMRVVFEGGKVSAVEQLKD